MMKASEFRNHGVTLGQGLRLVQKRQGLIEAFAHAKSVGEPDLRATQGFVIG